jgi:anti-sigma factor RsiW
MKSDHHLSEESLNMYLDGELRARERERARLHLATCKACRAELRALQGLFVALEALAPVPAPDLAPGVLARLGRAHSRPLQLVLALQTLAVSAWLAWGWTRLVEYWPTIVEVLPPLTLRETLAGAVDWAAAHWATLSTWLDALGDTWQAYGGGDSYLSLTQLAVLGVVMVMLWLVGNAVVLRRVLVNGQT